MEKWPGTRGAARAKDLHNFISSKRGQI